MDEASEVSTPDKSPNKPAEAITKWGYVRRFASMEHIKKLFGEIYKSHVLGSTCTDKGFLEYMKKRSQEAYGVPMESDEISMFFMKVCYVEYFRKCAVDLEAVLRSRTNMIDKLHSAARHPGSPPSSMKRKARINTEDKEENVKKRKERIHAARVLEKAESLIRKLQDEGILQEEAENLKISPENEIMHEAEALKNGTMHEAETLLLKVKVEELKEQNKKLQAEFDDYRLKMQMEVDEVKSERMKIQAELEEARSKYMEARSNYKEGVNLIADVKSAYIKLKEENKALRKHT